LRDLLVVKVSGDPKLLDSSSMQTSELQKQATLFSESDLVRFFHSLAETEASLKEAANPRYQVEVGLVKLMEMRRLAPLGDLVGRIAELENALRTGKPPAERKTSQAAPASGSSKAGARSAASGGSSTVARAVTTEEVRESDEAAAPTPGSSLDQIKAALVKQKRRLLIAAPDAARRAELVGDDFSIEFTSDTRHYRDTLAKTDNVKALREACSEVCGREIGILFSIKDDDGEAPASSEEAELRSKQSARQAAAQNPIVQQVLRAFGGEIVDVKAL